MSAREENLINKIIRLFFLASFIVLFILFITSFLSLLPYDFPLFIFPLVFIIIFSIAEKATSNEGYFIALFTGFWADVFSFLPFGFFILSFFIIVHTIKFLLQKYVNL